MTHLGELLTDVADQAPRTGMAERALRAARRRRARTLAAAPVAVLLAAGVVVGGTAALERLTPPGPTGQAERLGVLNAHVPGPLPARGVAPARLAYIDYCRATAERAAGRACSEWRVLTSDGMQYRVPHSLGAYRAGTNADGNVATPSRLAALSGDGRRIMYYRADSERVVVRDLAAGTERTVARLPLRTVRTRPVEFVLNRDGTWAGVETGVVTRSDASPHPSRPMLVNVASGTVARMPAGRVFDAINPDGTSYMEAAGADENSVAKYDTGGRVLERVADRSGFGPVSPDGKLLADLGVPWSRMLQTRDIRTGGVHATLTPRGLPTGNYAVQAWPRPATITIAGRFTAGHQVDDTKTGRFGFYLIDAGSGRIEGSGTFTITGRRTQIVYGAITPPGGG